MLVLYLVVQFYTTTYCYNSGNYSDLPRPDRGPFLESLGSTFLCRDYIQDRDINSFEIQTIKTPGSEREWTEF